jgi:hypothetical protein
MPGMEEGFGPLQVSEEATVVHERELKRACEEIQEAARVAARGGSWWVHTRVAFGRLTALVLDPRTPRKVNDAAGLLLLALAERVA